MPQLKFVGTVIAYPVQVRFSFSGKLKTVNIHTGDSVKKGDILATLDTAILQTQLDLELAAYEKTRAQFEIFHQKQTGLDDITKYLGVIEQADLDTSVKRVELAKAHLDEAMLRSPIDAVVSDDGGSIPGINITPASNYFTLIPQTHKYFQIDITQDQLAEFNRPRTLTLRFPNWQKTYSGTTSGPVPSHITKSNPPKYICLVTLLDCSDLLPGMVGEGELD